jgi:hypothetical protein
VTWIHLSVAQQIVHVVHKNKVLVLAQRSGQHTLRLRRRFVATAFFDANTKFKKWNTALFPNISLISVNGAPTINHVWDPRISTTFVERKDSYFSLTLAPFTFMTELFLVVCMFKTSNTTDLQKVDT